MQSIRLTRPRLFAPVLVLASLLCVANASAHHSFRAQYDATQPIEITGYVTKVEWTNPHVYIYVDIENAEGKIENWGFELGPPHALQNNGWKKNTLDIGAEVDISATRARDGSHNANARSVRLAGSDVRLGAASSEQLDR
ncbi:MAG: DUF6152 family protein [Pseudomonadota bacterium]